jgi:hypothetical protein
MSITVGVTLAQAALLACLVTTELVGAACAATPRIVLVSGPRQAVDFWDLFQPNAPWANAAAHVNEVGLPGQAMGLAGDDQLRRVIADLQRRNITIGRDMLPLAGSDPAGGQGCGYHVEGYSALGETAVLARRLKALGATNVSYGMDEPLFYGHYYRGLNACQSSIEAIAQDVARKVRDVRAVFPGVEVSEAEPLMGLPDATWLQDLAQWFDAYQAATGTPLAYFWLDLDWHARWQQRLPPLTALLREKGIGLGVIYNGDDRSTTDEAWIASAVAHYEAFETALGHSPDAVSFQTWVSHPTHVLPESDPRTLTSLVNRYVAWKASRN